MQKSLSNNDLFIYNNILKTNGGGISTTGVDSQIKKNSNQMIKLNIAK